MFTASLDDCLLLVARTAGLTDLPSMSAFLFVCSRMCVCVCVLS